MRWRTSTRISTRRGPRRRPVDETSRVPRSGGVAACSGAEPAASPLPARPRDWHRRSQCGGCRADAGLAGCLLPLADHQSHQPHDPHQRGRAVRRRARDAAGNHAVRRRLPDAVADRRHAGRPDRLQPVHRREALPHCRSGTGAIVLRPGDAHAAGPGDDALRVHLVRAVQRTFPAQPRRADTRLLTRRTG